MDGATYVVESTTTEEFAPADRADFWSDLIDSYQVRLDYRYPCRADFHGRTVRQRTSVYQLVSFRSERIDYIRTARQVRLEPDEDYRFLLLTGGEAIVHQDGRETRLVPGTGGLFTMAEPFLAAHGDLIQGFTMTIPAREVDGRLNRSSPLATGFDMTTGLGRVTADMIRTASEERASLTAVQFDALCDRITELLCMLAVGDDRPTAPGHLAEVEAVVRRHIRAHAADAGLTGAAMAQNLGWSLRQIQLALQYAGTTPRELIREERLRLVRDRLRSPHYRDMSITDLAHKSGFSSASALSTAFRRRFGVSPRELRHAGHIDHTGNDQDTGHPRDR